MKKYVYLFLFGIIFASCVTTAQKEVLQKEIKKLEAETAQLQERINAQLKQMERNTRLTLSSQNDLQNLQAHLDENSGEIDELKLRIKKLEDAITALTERHAAIKEKNEQTILNLQRQMAYLQLSVSEPVNPIDPNSKKQPVNVKTSKGVIKILTTEYEKGNFKELIQKSTSIILSKQSTSDMIAMALEFRGEGKFKLFDYRGAVIDLSNFVEKYPKSERHARALLLLGDSYVYLKNDPIAKSYYSDCLKKYSDTPEGAACAERIAKF